MERSVYTKRSIDGWLAKLDESVRSWLIPFRVKMEEDGLQPSTVREWLSKARLFLACLVEVRRQKPEDAQPADITAFIRARLRLCRKRCGRAPVYFVGWRCGYTVAIHGLLREIQGQWPPTTAWTLRLEGYKAHLVGRELDKIYVRELYSHARRFLQCINKRGLAIEDIQQSCMLFLRVRGVYDYG